MLGNLVISLFLWLDASLAISPMMHMLVKAAFISVI